MAFDDATAENHEYRDVCVCVFILGTSLSPNDGARVRVICSPPFKIRLNIMIQMRHALKRNRRSTGKSVPYMGIKYVIS